MKNNWQKKLKRTSAHLNKPIMVNTINQITISL
jgi:hypothetical protein